MVDAAPVDPAAADTVWQVARANGLTGPVEITPPEDAASAWTVAGIDNTWPVALDRVAVAPTAGTVLARSAFADWPLLARRRGIARRRRHWRCAPR